MMTTPEIFSLTDQHQENKLKLRSIKKILILTTCVFTAKGLDQLCSQNPLWDVTCINPEQIHSAEFLPAVKADLLITESECFNEFLLKTLVKTRTLPDKIILLTEHYTSVAQHYKTMRGVTFITDKSVSLHSLENLVSKALTHYTLEGDLNPGKHQRARMVECEVLLSLLNGEKPDTVAKKMGITYNAVSRYKMLALKRAGVKNLNEIITGKYRVFVSDFYQTLRSA